MNEPTIKSKNTESTSTHPVLPPSGLAEDILKRDGRSKILSDVSKQGKSDRPDQIYAFTDKLVASQAADETKKPDEKLEIWVAFVLNNEIFSLPVSHVQEILRVSNITKVPHAPEPVRGVTNMRGRVLPVVDLRVRLGMKSAEIGDMSRILVVESKGRLIGFLVDSVLQVIHLSGKGIEALGPDIMTAQSDYILGVYYFQDKLVILLDVDRLLTLNSPSQNKGTKEEQTI